MQSRSLQSPFSLYEGNKYELGGFLNHTVIHKHQTNQQSNCQGCYNVTAACFGMRVQYYPVSLATVLLE